MKKSLQLPIRTLTLATAVMRNVAVAQSVPTPSTVIPLTTARNTAITLHARLQKLWTDILSLSESLNRVLANEVTMRFTS